MKNYLRLISISFFLLAIVAKQSLADTTKLNVGSAGNLAQAVGNLYVVGNVGIGITAPASKLQVSGGNVLVGGYGGGSDYGVLFSPNDAGAWSWIAHVGTVNGLQLGSGATVGTTPYITMLDGGNVGIGTTAPGYKLDVIGGIRAANSASPTWGDVNGGAFNSNTTYAYSALCANNASGTCNASGGVVIGLGNATAAINIPTSGSVFFNNGGNVGIGTTAPAGGKLEVSSGTSQALRLTTSSAGPWAFGLYRSDLANEVLVFNSGSAWYFNNPIYAGAGNVLLNSSGGNSYINGGNVGIGNTAPGVKLDVTGDARIANTSWYYGLNSGGTSQPLIRSRGMRYNATVYPGVQVGQAGDHVALFIDPDTIAGGSFSGNINELLFPNAVNFLQGNSGSTDWMLTMALNNGSVGIGTTTPTSYKLEVIGNLLGGSAGTGANPGVKLSGNTVSSGLPSGQSSTGLDLNLDTIGTGNMVFKTGGTENMRIMSGGNVGIGTTAPNTKLHILDNNDGIAQIRVQNDFGTTGNQSQLTLQAENSSGVSTSWDIINWRGQINFWDGTADRMQLFNTGVLNVQTQVKVAGTALNLSCADVATNGTSTGDALCTAAAKGGCTFSMNDAGGVGSCGGVTAVGRTVRCCELNNGT